MQEPLRAERIEFCAQEPLYLGSWAALLDEQRLTNKVRPLNQRLLCQVMPFWERSNNALAPER